MEQKSFSGCFGCGQDNETGLKATFRTTEDSGVEGYFTPQESHCGYEDAVHVGVLTAFLSEAMGRLAFGRDKYYLTHKLEIKFKCAVSYGTRIRAYARQKRSSGKYFTAKGKLYGPDGETIAKAEGQFLQMDAPEVKKRIG